MQTEPSRLEPLGELRTGCLWFHGDRPAEIIDVPEDAEFATITEEQRHVMSQVALAVRAYTDAVSELLEGRFAHLRHLAPAYLAEPGTLIAFCCNEGVVIRYEKSASETRKRMVGWIKSDLPSTATMLSQNLIQVHRSRPFTPDFSAGMLIELSSTNAITGQSRELFSGKVVFNTVMEAPGRARPPGQKPYCIASVRSELEIQLQCEVHSADQDKPDGRSMILTRTLFTLPVGWDCIEIFPTADFGVWKPEHAALWAEADILSAVVARQHREAMFHTLDPNATVRAQYAILLKEFRSLLDSEPGREESLQEFLRRNPKLLCPTYTRMWPKLALGAHITDFVFRDASNDYLLVEIEKSTHSLFRKDGHPRTELHVAIGQIVDWKRYLEDNLRTVQHELGLTAITANPRSLVVIGRSAAVSADNRRKLLAMEAAQPRLRVMTYDDVYENAKAVIENLLGPIWEVGGETQIYNVEVGSVVPSEGRSRPGE